MATNLKTLLKRSGNHVRRALEDAANDCGARTHYRIAAVHLLRKLIEQTDGDTARIFQQFGVDTSRLATDLDQALRRLPTGNRLAPVLNRDLIDWVARARLIAPPGTRAQGVRGHTLILALLEDPELASLQQISREWGKIQPEALRGDFRAIVAGSNEGDPGAAGPRRLPGKAFLRWAGIGMILYWIIVPIVVLYGVSQAGPFLDQHLGGLAGSPGDPGYSTIAIACKRLLAVMIIVIALGGLEMIKLAFRQVAPSLGLDLAIEENDRRFDAWRRRPARNQTWKGIFAYGGIAMLVSVVIAGLLLLWQVSKQSLGDRVYTIALTDSPSTIPAKAKYVAIGGRVRAKTWLPYQTTGDSTPQAMALLTEEGWTPDRPVRYLAHYVATAADAGRKPDFPYDDRGGFPIIFHGKRGASLPTAIARKYEAQGIRIDPAAMVLDALPQAAMPQQDGVNFDYSIGALILGGAIAIFTVWVMFLMKVLARFKPKPT
jgi:hypothetical protein